MIHPYCRCTTVPYMKDLPDIETRWSRDPETGKGKFVKVDNGPKRLTFREWKKLTVDSTEYHKIVDVLGDKAPVSLAEFLNLKYNDSKKYGELKDRELWIGAEFPTKKSYDGHYETHRSEFGDITKEEYQQMAAELLAEPVSDDILGYDTGERRVRYDIKNNIFVLGNSEAKNITTMFKPDEGRDYYDGEYAKDVEKRR
ncbi:hypothetical protein C5L33_001326 [Lactobacillus pasteurii]|uniref:Uncharacterized protein n=2 Tax=Lactobacillus pasteurii TaxID=872327 RepID=I7JY90_9LACO|nr:hypothetical protein C5L33_001326 [Lactobacillus pasteurii]CCI85340.1 Putative uncharacterized protein [Lactobacillus pasteurii DSM 23907 = CRBIP 24.76]